VSEGAAHFLTWAIPHLTSDDRWLFALGLLIVAVRLRTGRIAESTLGEAAAWVFAAEAEKLGVACTARTPACGLSEGYWKPLGAELIREAAAVQADDVRHDLEFLGAWVLEGA
jgi:hypothetical protein